MKKIILLAVFVLFSIASFSQDRISTKKGSKLDVIVTEITPTLVRYKLFSEPNGRVFFVYKDDVESITYKDGKVETFNQSGDQAIESKNVQKENETQTQTQGQLQTQNKTQTHIYTQPKQSSSIVKTQINTVSETQTDNSRNQTNDYIQSDGKEKDIVYLTDGSIIRGTILTQTPNKLVEIKTANGKIVTCQMDDIEKIVAGTTGENYKSGRSSSGSSKGSSSGLNSGYRGIIDLGYYYGVGTYQINRVNFNFINGYQINPYFYVGIGTGVHYYYTDFSQPSDNVFLVPFFADLRANFINGPVSPYLSCDIGYSFNASSDSFNGEGILINPTAGVSFKLSERNEIHIGVGYQLQSFRIIYYYDDGNDYNYFPHSSHINVGALAFKVGFSF